MELLFSLWLCHRAQYKEYKAAASGKSIRAAEAARHRLCSASTAPSGPLKDPRERSHTAGLPWDAEAPACCQSGLFLCAALPQRDTRLIAAIKTLGAF